MSKEQVIARLISKVEMNDRYGKNTVRFGMNETYEHAKAKFDICWKLRENKLVYITECRFRHLKGRADIYVPEMDLAIEVVEWEKEKSIKLKSRKYPCDILVHRVGEEFNI